jgi:hypothetical protein
MGIKPTNVFVVLLIANYVSRKTKLVSGEAWAIRDTVVVQLHSSKF